MEETNRASSVRQLKSIYTKGQSNVSPINHMAPIKLSNFFPEDMRAPVNMQKVPPLTMDEGEARKKDSILSSQQFKKVRK